MSRVGKKPIELIDGASIVTSDGVLTVTGPKGELSFTLNENIEVAVEGKSIQIKTREESKAARELHGLTRSIISNMVIGVTSGFSKKLEFTGVGYRAQMEGNDLVLNLGFSHPIKYKPIDGIKIEVEKNSITVNGIDKQKVGQAAAEIRSFRKPEPYKGKGIRYEGEKIRRKAGKTAAKGS